MATIWSGWYWHLGLASLLAIGGALASGNCAIAQVTPDGTLGAESSVVTPTNVNGVPGNQIDGGAARGANLFHSFDEFSVPNGGEAFFNNSLDIQNIISRVTGSSISNIDGLLRANPSANLFLLNPNGIIFGPNATLNIGGSFMGSTASSLNFADGNQFSATAPTTIPLLTISVPIGLQYGGTAGSILNQSQATNSSGQPVGLRVLPGQTLALLGGNVSLDGGRLQAPGGRVELGGVAGAGTVGLQVDGNNLNLSFPVGVPRADVSLIGAVSPLGAYVTVFAGGLGSIAINARNLNLAENSGLVAGIEEKMGSIGSVAGDIQINATGTINLTNNALIANWVQPNAKGNGGGINVTARSLSVTKGGVISTSTSGEGDAGSVKITASDAISFDGSFYPNGFISGVRAGVEPGAEGKGGDINIEARSLSVTNGAQLFSGTQGRGNAGDVTIQVSDAISFDGVGSNRPSTQFSSGAFANVYNTAEGKGGDINITAGSLSVTNGALVSARTRGQRNGGNVTVNTNTLEAVNGGQVLTASLSSGKAGNITLNVTDSVTISGSDPTYSDRLAQFGEDLGEDLSVSSASGLFANTFENSTGQGGSLKITAGQLNVRDGAIVTVSSQGSGDAGNLEVGARSIRLDNQGKLTAETISGEGGNIVLEGQDLLLMRNNSLISAEASGTGNSGNINIDTDLLVAIPTENSDIIASALQGGNIDITGTQGIFGIQFRERLTPESDITASGTVTLNTPDVDPTQGLVELPAELVDASNSIATGCPDAVWRGESKFIITGRGGLPPNPYESLRGDNTLTNWSTLEEPDGENRSSTAPATNSTKETVPTTIVEANGWVKGPNGEVTLFATAPTANIDIPWLPESSCNAPEPKS